MGTGVGFPCCLLGFIFSLFGGSIGLWVSYGVSLYGGFPLVFFLGFLLGPLIYQSLLAARGVVDGGFEVPLVVLLIGHTSRPSIVNPSLCLRL